jgi:hypothetical protein
MYRKEIETEDEACTLWTSGFVKLKKGFVGWLSINYRVPRNLLLCEIFGFHCGEYEDYRVMGHDTVWVNSYVLSFRRNLPPRPGYSSCACNGFFFPVAQQPLTDQDLLIIEVSRSLAMEYQIYLLSLKYISFDRLLILVLYETNPLYLLIKCYNLFYTIHFLHKLFILI